MLATMNIFFPPNPIDVETIHGPGLVIYIMPMDSFANDIWCVANKKDGQLRHYETIQLKLMPNYTLGIRPK